jgi:tetratricopeptide (TPR) repeat protein
MKIYYTLMLSACLSQIHAQAVVDANQIQIIADDDSIKYYVDGKESAIANDDMAQYYLSRGLDFAVNSDYINAEQQFHLALLYDVDNAEILYNLGLAEYYQQQYENALHTFDFAADYDPENANIYNQRGLCKAMLEQYDAAELDFKIMLKYDPDFPMGNYNYGILLLQNGDTDHACKYLTKADKLGYENAKNVIEEYCK